VNKINTVFEYISKNSKKQFSEVPSTSVQSMMVTLSNTVTYGFKGDEFDINKDRLSLLSKCAIDSDATIGSNLPLIDPSKPDNGNLFVGIMNKFKSDTVSSKEFEQIIEYTDIKELKKIAKAEGIKMKEKSDFVKEYVPKVMKDFKQNITNLFDKILQEAKRLKAKAEKERAKAEKTSSNS
jgi:hypothetical protein